MQFVDLRTVPGLKTRERAAIRKHCAFSGRIERTYNIRSFLIKEVHQKRGNQDDNGHYRLEDPNLNEQYNTILYGGQEEPSDFSPYPSVFKSKLEDYLLRSVKRERDVALGFSLCNVYYNPTNTPLEELQAAMLFDTAEWELSEPANDQATLLRFRDEFISVMQQLTDAVVQLGGTAIEVARLKEEIVRYRTVCGLEASG